MSDFKRRKQENSFWNRDVKPFWFYLIFILFSISLFSSLNFATPEAEGINTQLSTQNTTTSIVEPTTKELIESLAKEYNVCVETALKIAECESQFGKYNHNWEGSSAKGVYMFIDRTWDHYCNGDVMNDVDNITCFMRLYNKHPHWWACK